MGKYLFSTGLFSAVLGGFTLLRDLGDRERPFTWRSGLAWASWGITLVLAVGAIVDTFRAGRGRPIPGDSPVAGKEQKLAKKHARHV